MRVKKIIDKEKRQMKWRSIKIASPTYGCFISLSVRMEEYYGLLIHQIALYM